MQTSYIVTFIGDDRPGLVEEVSHVIERNGGNWQESRLSQLGGKFAGLILVSLPADGGTSLEAELSALAASGISVRVTPSTASTRGEAGAGKPATPPPGRNITLTVIGPDRRGIVREISHALARRRINVLEMESEVRSAPMSAEMIFSARIEAWIPEATNLDDLRDKLDEIANTMTLEIDLEE
jgi:glycine cleavage system regulatory protein